MKYCLIVPHYNHERQFIEFLPKLLSTELTCIIVDDGSFEESVNTLKQFCDGNSQIHFVEHTYNRGKGAAVISAVHQARALGFTHVIQIDADGQHAVDDIQRFISESEQLPETFICGRPVFDESVPKVRMYGRKVTDFWVMVETLSTQIKDGLCGFRVYPLKQVECLLDTFHVGSRMDFDTEILVKAVWLNFSLKFVDTLVVYPEQSVSHFKYLRDNILLIRLHSRLIAGMILRSPVLLLRLIKRRF